MVAGRLLGRGKEPHTVTAVLPLLGRRRGAEGDHAPVDVELAQEGRPGKFVAEGPVREPEPGEPDEGVPGTGLDESFFPAAGMVGEGRDPRLLRRNRRNDSWNTK